MRILYDSKQLLYKDPFGTLTPGQCCCLSIHIPASVKATAVSCVFIRDGVGEVQTAQLTCQESCGPYQIFRGSFSLETPGLYFYYFRIFKEEGSFRLFKQGDDTNMEAGDLWQVSCIPEDFTTPDWAKGAVIYQVFPDRFCKTGSCDLTGKLQPFTIHDCWHEEVIWQPTADGKILNNDFYGGNFQGIAEKLDYIASLGATVLYLNPISKSFSNHRYDTGDYKMPDPMLGTLEDFAALCRAAHEKGIRVVLDGVFSHTGSNSLYFDKEGTFGGNGAYCRSNSPYFSWYTFHRYPDHYDSWWGFDTLPTVKKMDPAFVDYIITGRNSVIAHWLKLGADGFRLDVVDELPNEFVSLLKQQLRQIKPDALLIGEVWEDASNKIAYDIRRRYFTDAVLDSAMNYPFRTAILDYLWERDDGRGVKNTVMTIAENYPPQVLACNMNLLGSHDTPRILTALADTFEGPREEAAKRFLSPEQLQLARERLYLATFLQFTLPGAPSIYYGDEAGLEGHKDPFNRRPYPWGRENAQLLDHFRQLGNLRRSRPCLQQGDIQFSQADNGRLCFTRSLQGKVLRIFLNRSRENWDISGVPLLGHNHQVTAPNRATLLPMGCCITEE